MDEFKYESDPALSNMENLVAEHDLYDRFEQVYQEGVVKAAIKKGEICLKAKEELKANGKKPTNQAVADHFARSESHVRMYIKIYEHRKFFVTPITKILSVNQMMKIIQEKTSKPAKPSQQKQPTISHKDRKIFKLEEELRIMQEELEARNKLLLSAEKKITEMEIKLEEN